MVPLEPQHAHPEDARLLQLVREAVRDGAEVLAENDGAVADALQRDQPEEVLQREGEVGAFGRGRPVRHDPEPREAHDVVDPHAAGVAHRGAHHLQVSAEAVPDEAARRERGEAPALPTGAEQVRRRPDGQAHQSLGLAAPAMAAPGVRAHGEVGDEADRHPGGSRRALRRREAAVRQELHEGVRGDLALVFGRELQHGRAVRVAILLGPLEPVPARRVGAEDAGVQGFEPGVGFERVASLPAELGELGVGDRNGWAVERV